MFQVQCVNPNDGTTITAQVEVLDDGAFAIVDADTDLTDEVADAIYEAAPETLRHLAAEAEAEGLDRLAREI